VQGTGEHGTFAREQLDALLSIAVRGIETLDALQLRVLAEPFPNPR
jgi:ribonuclease PH